jgi:hypothetical protein
VGHGRGDHFLLFALIQSVKLAISAKYEDAVNAVGDEAVEKPTQPRQVEVLVRKHGGGNGRNDAADLHEELSREFPKDEGSV